MENLVDTQDKKNSVDTENDITQENNKEIIDGLGVKPSDFDNIFSMSVNWTFRGICELVQNGEIELSPSFQRKNAWNSEKKSELIESLLLNMPIPPIILAEYETDRKKYMVIDGKQRLQTMIGFFMPEQYPYWKESKGKIIELSILKKLNGLYYENLPSDTKRMLNNTVVPVWELHNSDKINNNKVLYQIFYRINAVAVPLNTQELRQALYAGQFSDYLATTTNTLQPFQEVMGYTEPDERVNDAEFLLRVFANKFTKNFNKGNLADFLDKSMKYLNEKWDILENEIKMYYANINKAIDFLVKIFGTEKEIANVEKTKKRFNKSLFEVQLYYFAELNEASISEENIKIFKINLENSFKERTFADLFIKGTNASYKQRFEAFGKLIEVSFKIKVK